MRQEGVFAVWHGLLFLMESDGCEIPESIDAREFGVTTSCIAIGVTHAIDGEVAVVLTDEPDAERLRPEFEACLATPNRQVCLFNTDLEQLLCLPVGSDQTRVSVYFPGSKDRDIVVVAISS